MSFDFDDIMEVLQIVKECKDAELYIETGEMKLSVFRGDIGDSTRGPASISQPAEAAVAPPAP